MINRLVENIFFFWVLIKFLCFLRFNCFHFFLFRVASSLCQLNYSELNGICYLKNEIKPLKWLNGVSGGYGPMNQTESVPCPAGTFAYSDGLMFPWECKDCPPGTVCESGFPFIPWSRGVVTTKIGTFDKEHNQPCPPGYFCHPGQFPDFCPLGSYLKMVKSHVVNFPFLTEYDSYYNETIEFVIDSVCESCPIGSFCPINAQNPIKCPEGNYTKYVNQSACSICDKGLGDDCRNRKEIKERLAVKPNITGYKQPLQYSNPIKYVL